MRRYFNSTYRGSNCALMGLIRHRPELSLQQSSQPQWRGFTKLWQFRSAKEPELNTGDQGPFWRNSPTGRVEAVLFLGREPQSSRRIAQLANLSDGTEARTLIRRLNRLYDAAGSAFRVQEVAGGYRLLTRPALSPWLRRLLQTPVDVRLSAPALETLAVVAYRQPILRFEIEAVRGVQCDDILRQLLEKDLVRILGRSNDLGRPLLYGTTKRFLELFGLRHLDELPRAAELCVSAEQATATVIQPTGASVTENSADSNPGAVRVHETNRSETIPEEKSVTIRIRSALVRHDDENSLKALTEAARRQPIARPLSAAKDDEDVEDEEEEDDEDDDEEWDDDEEEEDEEDDDFVDDEWEEVDDDDEEDEEDDDEEDDDEEWDDDEEDWDEDDDEEDEEWEEEGE